MREPLYAKNLPWQRHRINWHFGKAISTREDAAQAEAFYAHCCLAGYSHIPEYSENLDKLMQEVKDFAAKDTKTK